MHVDAVPFLHHVADLSGRQGVLRIRILLKDAVQIEEPQPAVILVLKVASL